MTSSAVINNVVPSVAAQNIPDKLNVIYFIEHGTDTWIWKYHPRPHIWANEYPRCHSLSSNIHKTPTELSLVSLSERVETQNMVVRDAR